MHTHIPDASHTPLHKLTLLHTCTQNLRGAFFQDTHTFFYTHTHALCSWTQQNHTGLLSPTSRDFRMSTGNTAPTVRHSFLPAHPLPSLPLSPPSFSPHSFIPCSPYCEVACVAEGHSAALCCGVALRCKSWRARSDRGIDRLTALPSLPLPSFFLCRCLSLYPRALSFMNVTSISGKCWFCQASVFSPFLSQGASERRGDARRA